MASTLRGLTAIIIVTVLALLVYSSLLNDTYYKVFTRDGSYNDSIGNDSTSTPFHQHPTHSATLSTTKSAATSKRNIAAVTKLVTPVSISTPTNMTKVSTTLDTNVGNVGNKTVLPTRATVPVPTNEAKLVVLLSYQRTGSSFLSDILFNFNPEAFFVYEPLDPLYAAMFGVEQGWTIPADITTNLDGSLRVPPKVELDAVTWLLDQMLVCNMTSFPLEFYIHQLWSMFQTRMKVISSYKTCMNAQQLLGAPLRKCQLSIKTVCGHKFAEKGRRQDLCLKHMWNHESIASAPTRRGKSSFEDYDKCVSKFSHQVKTCIPRLEQPCTTRGLRATKTVRATMRSMESLLEKYPNMYVIHAYRDPRSTVLSRKKADWARSIYEKDNNVSKVAHAYCQTVLDDFRKRKQLEVKYPGRLMEVVYKDFIRDPRKKMQEVYKFLGLPISPAFESEVRKHTNNDKSKTISDKWKTQLKPDEVKRIMKSCQEFAAETGFNWDT